MTLGTGSYRLGPQAGRLLLKTGRTGLGRRAGHDLTIEATRWQADVVVNTADPGQSSVTVTIEADSVEVREGTGGLKPLTDADRADIKTTICEKILLIAGHRREYRFGRLNRGREKTGREQEQEAPHGSPSSRCTSRM